jgi:quinol monooxygenase YgiN
MIVLLAKYYCKPGKADEVEAYLKEIKPMVQRLEPGCALYCVSRSQENKDLFLIYEHYVDQAALEAHRETPHFKQIIEGKIIPLLERREREFSTLIES